MVATLRDALFSQHHQTRILNDVLSECRRVDGTQCADLVGTAMQAEGEPAERAQMAPTLLDIVSNPAQEEAPTVDTTVVCEEIEAALASHNPTHITWTVLACLRVFPKLRARICSHTPRAIAEPYFATFISRIDRVFGFMPYGGKKSAIVSPALEPAEATANEWVILRELIHQHNAKGHRRPTLS